MIFEMAIKKHVNFFRLFHFTKVLVKPSLKGSGSLFKIYYAKKETPHIKIKNITR